MRIGRSTNANRTRVVVLTADAEFEASTRATFGASSRIDLALVSGRLSEAGDTLDVGGATVAVVDFDAGQPDEMAALARLMTRVGEWPPVIALTQNFDENLARTLMQMRVADFLVKPVAADRSCARLRPRRQGPGRRRRADRSANLYLPARGRRRRRDHARGADGDVVVEQRRPACAAVDLPGRSRFPARRRRRLSRSRAAPQPGRDRTAPGPARPPIAGSDAVVSRLRPRRDRRARTGRRKCAASIPTW